MNAKNLWLKFFIVGVLVAVCLYMFFAKGLRQGIDLKGGHSLIFEISTNEAEIEQLSALKEKLEAELSTAAGDEVETLTNRLRRVDRDLERLKKGDSDLGNLAERMIAILKKRVDPQGLMSLEWRPLGKNRIEVRMPAGKSDSQEKRAQYFQMLEQMEEKNISRSEIRSVLRAPQDERAEKIQRLTRGDADQMQRFEALIAAYDEMTVAETARNRAEDKRIEALRTRASSSRLKKLEAALTEVQAEFDDAQIFYEDKLKVLQETNISQQRLQGILNNYVSKADEKSIGNSTEVKRLKDIYQNELSRLIEAHPARRDEVEQIVKLYEDWANIRGQLDDPADLERLIAKAGVLEYRIAPYRPRAAQEALVTISEAEMVECLKSLQTDGPEGLKKRNERFQWFPIRGDKKGYAKLIAAEFAGQLYLLLHNQNAYMMLRELGEGGWELDGAFPDTDQRGLPAVGFTFDEQGARRFARLTSDHTGRCLAVLLDDEVYSAPEIRTTISRQGVITGKFTSAEVDDMVRILEAGSLPARLNPEPISKNTFGPAIGAVNREMGVRAAIYGLIAVAAFMLVYYLMAGAIANVALLLNIILVLGAMSFLEAVFTLPGIAGIILTIGIAVDANVLIFERLREEQAKGQSVRMALKNAYERAFSAILDANITTMLVCLILGWVGTEEVRGFAITLGLGVLFSLFTALVVTRWVFQVLLDFRLLKKPVFMLRLLGTPKVNWMSKRHLFWGLSLVMVALGTGSLVWQGGDIWGIEFSSGTQAVITFGDDALIDGKLPDDAIVRDRFKVQAETLGFARLHDTARVETQVNPYRVRDFIRDYDDRNAPDGQVSLAEWEASKMNAEFFKLIDSDSDGVLKREELAESLPPLSYQISTTETLLGRIRDTAREAFGESLQVRSRRRFELVRNKRVTGLGVRMPVNGRLRITPDLWRSIASAYREEMLDYEGGVLLVIENVEAPISQTELVQRIREMRFQVDFKDQMLSQSEVIGLTQAGELEDEFSAFAVVIQPTEMQRVDTPGAWDRFVDGELALLTAALQREEAMVASNFDAAIAGETAQLAIVAVVLSWGVIVVYLWLRFGSVQWGLAAVICLIHDVIIVVGLVAASGWVYGTYLGDMLGIQSFKIDLAMIAAILTVIGYSVNDTIVVFDRIRENRGKLTTVSGQVINASINQTLSRTLLTSGTTFIVVIIMYVAGGPGIHAFNYALLAGILFGTYSSIAVASPLLMGFRRALVAKVAAPVAEAE
ncbi:MAG: protein translocase subunit SecD [Planctomycetota bacterium]|jgi:SecD/SecF fusion protein